MRKQLIILCFLSMAFSIQARAQNTWTNTAHVSSLFNSHFLLAFSHNLSLTQTQPVQGSFLLYQAVNPAEIRSGSIHDMPFFCAMECRLRERTGLWIKFRTGDDASYEKLIRSPEK